MKITVGNTDGKTYQLETEEPAQLVGQKIGEEFDGGIIGLPGYTLKVTGGSDKQGFPMRRSIEGPLRKRILIGDGSGVNSEEGIRKRKSVRGNTVSEDIEQLNTKVVEEGSQSIEDLLSEEDEE